MTESIVEDRGSDGVDDDDSSLTSLSDLEHDGGESTADRPGTTEGKNRPDGQTAAGLPSPSRTPKLDLLLSTREREFERAIREATTDYALQETSFTVVQAALDSLPTGEQQAMLALMLNRYSSFCTSVDMPVFPLSPTKVALFLSQALVTRHGDDDDDDDDGRHPEPLVRLPTVDPRDSTVLACDVEGTRVTRELADAWVQALAYAHVATSAIWSPTPTPDSDMDGTTGSSSLSATATPTAEALGSSSLLLLTNDPVIAEIVDAIPSISDWHVYEHDRTTTTIAESQHSNPTATTTTTTMTTTTTRWTKRGKVVAGPQPPPPPPPPRPS
ncbi:hypothetical protein JCM11491_006039, partial [Sporobolomyces phaffii]